MDEDLRKKLEQIYFQFFEVKFENGINRSSVAKWDSLNHVKLMLLVEKQFGVSFTIQEAVAIQSTDDLENAVSRKCH